MDLIMFPEGDDPFESDITHEEYIDKYFSSVGESATQQAERLFSPIGIDPQKVEAEIEPREGYWFC